MAIYDLISAMGHEQVVFTHDKATGLKAIIAIHDTTLGPSLGGCRLWLRPLMRHVCDLIGEPDVVVIMIGDLVRGPCRACGRERDHRLLVDYLK